MILYSTSAFACLFLTANGDGASSLLSHFGVTAALAFLPFLAIAGTSFIKIALVLSILRSALGAPGVPPTSVLTALAAILSMFIMAPVGAEMADALELTAKGTQVSGDTFGFAQTKALYEAASPPLVDFLHHNTPASEIEFFAGMIGANPTPEPGLRILLPAFAVGEIVEAFLIGFLIFVPFLVIDLIVANTLLALGMHMLSPMAISLPLKLVLFVAVDGWHVLLSGLIINYAL
ncbi:MAG: flagellar biosynthetic protein FliP [Proteobacteria bacterium]|nr:flagellar biosynthetic protein FliP [Pseudomonadota bacterium]